MTENTFCTRCGNGHSITAIMLSFVEPKNGKQVITVSAVMFCAASAGLLQGLFAYALHLCGADTLLVPFATTSHPNAARCHAPCLEDWYLWHGFCQSALSLARRACSQLPSMWVGVAGVERLLCL